MILTLAMFLISCGTATPITTPTREPEPTLPASATLDPPSVTPRLTTTGDPTRTPRPTDSKATATPAATVTSAPASWQDMPIIPTGVSDRMREVYQRGLQLGRDPRAFAKIGDCGGTPSWFLGPFDDEPEGYRLGEYTYLVDVIEHFAGSYGRASVAARPGFNVSSIFSPLWSDPEQCRSGEGPLICEIRVTNATYAFFMMGTNDVWHQDKFESQMRRAIEDLLERGVVPILSTKADNVEQDGSINAAIVRLALEYEAPLWNYWAAAQPLPDHGLQEDGVHLTWAGNRFDDPEAMARGWPVRNLTALQALDAVWRGVTEQK